MPYKQHARMCTIDTPLGTDTLLVERVSGTETVSRLFGFDVDLVSEKGTIDFKSIVGQSVTLHIELEGGERRHINGLVSRFSQGQADRRFVSYRAQIVPRLWLLTRNASSRIFQEKSVPDIIKKVLSDGGLTDVEFELTESYDPRVYCVQYRETDYNFIARLMEEEGISFYFKHEDGRHVLVLADAKGSFCRCSGQPEAEYASLEGAARLAGEVEQWHTEREYHSGRFALTDFNFETPGTSLLTSTPTSDAVGGNTKCEIYDWPGDHSNLGEGDRRVRLRMEAAECAAVRSAGNGTCIAFSAGQRFTLKGHYRDDCNCEYVLTSVTHDLAQSVEKGGARYENSFTCIPSSIRLRPSFQTPKPFVQGVQTAIVTGPAGEEIYLDKYGRVKVQFHWDREGKKDQNTSCWVRVSQPVAGKGWGAHYWPRIGQEVIVHFEEGDPDRPIVVGRVYNAQQMPPYELPANSTRSGIKTRSSKGGGGYNEIRLEDSKGSEEIFIHAQKDQNVVIENDKTETVGANRTRMVQQHESVTVALTRTHNVGINEMINVGAAQEVTVGAARAVTVGLSQTTTIGKSQSVSVGDDRDVDVGKNENVHVGKNLLIDAGDQITIQTGSAKIQMKKNGDILIEGKKITIKASGDVVVKGQKILNN